MKADVLAVDDDPAVADLSRSLSMSGTLTFRWAKTLAEGRERLAERRPDLLVLDVVLPDGNGLDLLAALRSDEKTKGLTVLVVTSLHEERYPRRAAELGAEFAKKPLRAFALLELLRKLTQS